MLDIVFRAGTYILIVILAYMMKRKGIVKKEHSGIFMKLLLWVTLPCAVVTSFKIEGNLVGLLMLPVASAVINLLLMLLGRCIGKGSGEKKKNLYMLNIPGYNIGAFSLPFVYSFLGPSAIAAVCMFDTGNSLVFNGVMYAYSSSYNGGKTSVITIVKKMFSSITFDSYLVMLVLSVLNITLPSYITEACSVGANANPFLAMFVVGLLLDFNAKTSFVKSTVLILAIRYGLSIILSLVAYNLLPFSLEIRQGLVLVLFAPIPALASAFTEQCGSESDISGFATSCSFVLSIAFITSLVMLFGLNV